jgi:RNA polymerase sigma-70 factor, ECF subfamily
MMRNDDRLLERLRNGDPAAWREVWEEHSDRLNDAALRLTGNAADADDLVQETLLAMARQIRRGKIEHLGNISSWLRRLMTYRFSDVIVRQQRGGRRRVKVEYYAEPADVAGPDRDDPALLCEFADICERTRRAVEQLDQPLRAVVQRKHFADPPVGNEQLAQEFGVSTAVIQGRLRRAYAGLRVRLAAPRAVPTNGAEVSPSDAGSYNRAQ